MECYTAHFEFGLGHNKGEELKKDTIVEAVRVVKDPANKDAVSAAKVIKADNIW